MPAGPGISSDTNRRYQFPGPARSGNWDMNHAALSGQWGDVAADHNNLHGCLGLNPPAREGSKPGRAARSCMAAHLPGKPGERSTGGGSHQGIYVFW
jgi:hypothetical protein